MCKIEKNIPIPQYLLDAERSPGSYRFPIKLMEIGDSFFTTDPLVKKSVVNYNTNYPAKKWRYLSEGDGWRVWRIR